MSDSPTVSQQYAFSVGKDGDTDGIEPSEESVETDLEAFGANVDHRERDTRIAQPEASSFGIDDRATVTRRDGGEQRALFADAEDDQQTLTGERAASQCLFESHDAESDDDPDAVITASDETPRALADGGHVKEDDESGPQSDEGKDEGNELDESDDSHEDGANAASDDDSNDADTTFDPDAETVTDAWEGAYISASWGYNRL